MSELYSPEQYDPSNELESVGRFEVLNNYQAGVMLSFEVDGKRAEMTLSPREALALSQLIESHREELEKAGNSPVEEAHLSRDPIHISRGDGPMPIPQNKHYRGSES